MLEAQGETSVNFIDVARHPETSIKFIDVARHPETSIKFIDVARHPETSIKFKGVVLEVPKGSFTATSIERLRRLRFRTLWF